MEVSAGVGAEVADRTWEKVVARGTSVVSGEEAAAGEAAAAAAAAACIEDCCEKGTDGSELRIGA
jgi:hypothetical protein